MEIRILASADQHIGMRFTDYAGIQDTLRQARLAALENLVQIGNAEQCDLLVVAGDLFDRLTVAGREVRRAAQILDGFRGETAVLPGNHDFLPAGGCELWDTFRQAAGPRTVLLEKRRAYDLEVGPLGLRLYPGPCDSKHSRQNAVAWVGPARRQEAVGEADPLRLGVAHGSLVGLSPDRQGEYFPMDPGELAAAGLDFWIVGHTHAPYPPSDGSEQTVLVPGTPEPDGFDCHHGGTAWLLEAQAGQAPRRRLMATGRCRFLEEEIQVKSPLDLPRVVDRYRAPDYKRTVLRVRLRGRLSREERERLSDELARLEGEAFWFRGDDSGVLEELGSQTIEAEFSRGSFPHRLLRRLLEQGDLEALQAAYSLIQESRK
jgi:exonuclease SbcD